MRGVYFLIYCEGDLMKKKLGLTLAMVLLAAVGANSSVLHPARSGVSKVIYYCPELPPDCCRTTRVGNCIVCAQAGC
jgi:hypothetical protein